MDWTRGRTIGRGSSATVSAATSRRSGDIFAVKSVELSQAKPLQREQKIISTLSSPHVVSYIGYDITAENNKLIYNLLLEYVSGGTLSDEIRKLEGRLDESMIGYYTHQIVQGLEYLHSSGIAHCDIKGQNILIGDGGTKIADFGCAKWLNSVEVISDEAANSMPIGGTPMFMSPEGARGDEQGFPADIWALGCTVIEMATGGSPWPNLTDPVSVLYRIAFSGELPEFPSFLSNQAKDFLSKCLRRDPKERWTAKQLLKHPFLEESNSHAKQNLDFNSNSPTSILDQGIWSSIEKSETLAGTTPTSCSNSLATRIRRLSSSSGLPNWTWDENWTTIRSNNNDKGQEFIEDMHNEANAVCGSVTASISNEMEKVINFSGSNVSGSNRSSSSTLASSLQFERDKELLLIQSQFL